MGHTTYKGLTRGRATMATLVALLGGLVGLLALSSSGAGAQDASTRTDTPNGPERVYALTASDKLLRFDGDNPRQATKKNITGLRNGESLVGIDFRPATGPQGVLYGVGDRSYIYTIDEDTGAAVRGLQITADGQPVALRGTSFGIDFNPTVDRLRIVSDANQNLRVNVDTGMLADFDPATPGTQPDRDLQYAANDRNAGENPAVTAVAYTNSQPGATTTTLYDIDARTMDLSIQNPPNDGTLNTVGSLGRPIKKISGFDIVTVGTTNRAYAALQRAGNDDSRFFRVNLETGRTTAIGTIGNGPDVEGLAIPINQP